MWRNYHIIRISPAQLCVAGIFDCREKSMKAVIFDMDGVLVDSQQASGALARVLSQLVEDGDTVLSPRETRY